MTPELRFSMPTGTQLSLQLPTGRLATSTIAESRVDSNIGDAEFRLRQSLPWIDKPRIDLAIGLAAPTGPYVARSGAANLPPEATFLTLGRGVSWGIVEVQLSLPLTSKASSYVQLSARRPFGKTEDDFEWGSEIRTVLGAQFQLPHGLAALVIGEVQWRGRAFEPDPFAGGRVESANAGGVWTTLTPALSYALSSNLSLLGGLRVPVHADVHGNQLVPSTGGFLALSGTYSPQSSSTSGEVGDPSPDWRPPAPSLGKITIVDYWATWCAPCKDIDRALQAAHSGWNDVEIIRVDASNAVEDGVKLPDGVIGLPAIEIYDKDGKRIHLLTGPDASNVVDFINNLRNTQ